MAKGKKSSGKHYVSKGQRPNVNKKIRNEVKNSKSISSYSLLQRSSNRELIKYKPQNKQQKDLQERYKKEDIEFVEASRVYSKYSSVGLTWAAAMQAAKTQHIEKLEQKWSKISRAIQEEHKKARNATSRLMELNS